MKKLLLLFLFPLFLSAQTDTKNSKTLEWLTDYDTALEKAGNENKNILVYFTGSDWCPPCIALKKDLFETTTFIDHSKNYILLYVDLPRNKNLISSDQRLHNSNLRKKLNKRGVFPFFKVVSPNGKPLDEISGYTMNGNVRSHLRLLKKHKI